LLVDGQVGVPSGPLALLERPLREERLVGEHQDTPIALGLLQLRQQPLAVLREVATHALRHRLLEPDLLAPDPVPQVEAAERGHRDALVRKLAVEEHGPLLHREPRPLLERAEVCQEVHVLLVEPAHELSAGASPFGPECGPADVLHLVVGDAERPRDGAVGGVLAGVGRGPRAPVSEQQHRLSDRGLMLLGQLRKATVLLHHSAIKDQLL